MQHAAFVTVRQTTENLKQEQLPNSKQQFIFITQQQTAASAKAVVMQHAV